MISKFRLFLYRLSNIIVFANAVNQRRYGILILGAGDILFTSIGLYGKTCIISGIYLYESDAVMGIQRI